MNFFIMWQDTFDKNNFTKDFLLKNVLFFLHKMISFAFTTYDADTKLVM